MNLRGEGSFDKGMMLGDYAKVAQSFRKKMIQIKRKHFEEKKCILVRRSNVMQSPFGNLLYELN